MSVIQRNSMSASGWTVMRKSGLRCRVMCSRLIARTRAITLVSRKGMKLAGANVKGRELLFFIDRVAVDPGAGGGEVFVPEHEVGVRARLEPAFAAKTEQPGRVERAHGP